MRHERITLTDTGHSIFMKLAEGNPGALSVLVQLWEQSPKIDPDAIMGSVAPMLDLDTLGIYGSHIWLLFRDVCRQSVPLTLAVLRANQLGFLPEPDLKAAIAGTARIDPDVLFERVCERLPAFAKAVNAALTD